MANVYTPEEFIMQVCRTKAAKALQSEDPQQMRDHLHIIWDYLNSYLTRPKENNG